MEKEYVKLWLSYEAYFEPLTKEEVGSLVLAMIEYRATGEEPELTGNERFVWPAVKRDLDETVQSLEKLRERQTTNGQKGGRPQKNPKNPVVFAETQKSQGKGKGNGKGQGPLEAYASCAEPDGGASASTQEVLALPLNDGSDFPVDAALCREWQALYPAVNVEQQLRSMRGWRLSNPAKRKTGRGIQRFITNWLAREQDRTVPPGGTAVPILNPEPGRQSWAELAAEMDREEGLL